MSLEIPFPRLRIGLWLDDLGLTLREGLKEASGWRLEAAGLDAFGSEVSSRVLSVSGRKDLAHRIRSAGLVLHALRADSGGRRLADTNTLDANLARIRAAFELARDLGVRQLVLPLGHIPPTTAQTGLGARTALREAVQALASFGSTLGVRPLAQAGNEPATELAAFLQEHDPGGLFGVDLNPGRLVSRGEEALAALPVLSERIALASIADYYLGGGEAPFGEGDVPFGGLLVVLSALSGAAPLALLAACSRECDRVLALRQSVERLKKLRLRPLN